MVNSSFERIGVAPGCQSELQRSGGGHIFSSSISHDMMEKRSWIVGGRDQDDRLALREGATRGDPTFHISSPKPRLRSIEVKTVKKYKSGQVSNPEAVILMQDLPSLFAKQSASLCHPPVLQPETGTELMSIRKIHL